MCGIIGFVDKKNRLTDKNKEAVLKEMLKEISYRGYDNTATFLDNNVGMGHNRLSILDNSPKANQPFINKNNNLVASYNGEIFNHLELRTIAKNYIYETHSDTETLVSVYEVIKEKIFSLIRGMFAISLYNRDIQQILLVVDSFGIKPLYYINTPDWFAWSSEVKSFKHLPDFSFSLNQDKLFEHVIFRTTTGKHTLFKNVFRVNPSEILKYDINKDILASSNYVYDNNEKESSIQSLLKSSVSEHVLSDVPIGFQLSGGVDSSLISFLAKGKIDQAEIHSFSIGLSDPDWNEFKYSRQVARQINTKHHEIEFTQKDFCENLPLSTFHLDEPISYPNTVPIMLLSREARKHVKVLLSGEGADEIFGGYTRYQKLLGKILDDETLLFSNSFCSKEDLSNLFVIKNKEIQDRNIILENIQNKDPVERLCLYDIKTFLPSLLLRQDKMGMASNLENRFPFLDPRLVMSAMSLNGDEKCSSQQSKIYLKNIARKYLPNQIVDRKKCGFGLPIKDWLRDSDGFGKYLNMFKKPKSKRSYLNYENISKYIAEHVSGSKDNSEVLWILISLELWVRIFIDGDDCEKIWVGL